MSAVGRTPRRTSPSIGNWLKMRSQPCAAAFFAIKNRQKRRKNGRTVLFMVRAKWMLKKCLPKKKRRVSAKIGLGDGFKTGSKLAKKRGLEKGHFLGFIKICFVILPHSYIGFSHRSHRKTYARYVKTLCNYVIKT